MPKIRIIDIPPGQAPQHIRSGWIGVEIPINLSDPDKSPGLQVGLRGGAPQNLGGYKVSASDAFSALKAKSMSCFKWWEENGYTNGALSHLVFRRDVCELIE